MENCKFQKFNKGCKVPYCYVTNGECQFVDHGKFGTCPIEDAFKHLEVKEA